MKPGCGANKHNTQQETSAHVNTLMMNSCPSSY